MASRPPKVSIGLPVYDGENFLSQALDSLLAQSFTDFEVIVSDNGSTDRTREICASYAARDPRISVVRVEDNLGAAYNFNRVFELSSGQYFKWMAHDDLIAPDFLARCVDILDRDPSIVLCFSKVVVIDGQGQQVDEYSIGLDTDNAKPGRRFRSLLIDWHMCFDVFGLIRTEALGRMPVMGNYGHADGVLLARLGLIGRFHNIPEALFFSRRHQEQSMRVYGYSVDEGGNDYHAYAAWFDPSRSNKLVFPQWRILGEYYKLAWLPNLTLHTRVESHLYVFWWAIKARRHLLSDVLHAGRSIIGRVVSIKRSFSADRKSTISHPRDQ
ncbi:MAG: glycosyltransferase [Hyphomicrobiaceae bacterium]